MEDFHTELAKQLAKKLGNNIKVIQKKTTVSDFVIKPNNDIKAVTMGHIEIDFNPEEGKNED